MYTSSGAMDVWGRGCRWQVDLPLRLSRMHYVEVLGKMVVDTVCCFPFGVPQMSYISMTTRVTLDVCRPPYDTSRKCLCPSPRSKPVNTKTSRCKRARDQRRQPGYQIREEWGCVTMSVSIPHHLIYVPKSEDVHIEEESQSTHVHDLF